MYIQLVRLDRYTRLMLKNIQSFEWTPTKNLMVIIGSNGSGKSSLLGELSPLPSHHSEFDDGGGKTVHCTHRGIQYCCTSVYSGKGTGHHSFIRGTEELNSGGTYQIQLDLCKAEFGLQQDIQDILTGRTKFSQLATNKRRDWLTRMSPVDLGFAFRLFAKVNDAAKAEKTIITHTNKRLANENVDMLADNDIDRLRLDRQRLTDRVNNLFLHRQPGKQQQFRNLDHAATELAAIMHSAKALLRQHPRLSDNFRVKGKGEYDRTVNGRLATLQASQAVIDRLMEELETIRATVPAQMDRTSPEEIAELRDRLVHHTQAADEQLETMRNYNGDIPLCRTGLFGDQQARLDDAFDRAYTLVMTIPNNPTGELSTTIAQEKRAQLTECKTKLRSIEEAISEVLRRIATLKGCDHVQCPNCQHTFAPGVDPRDLPQLEERLRRATAAEVHYTAEIKALDEYLERYTDYAGYVGQFQQITRDHRDFQPVWEWMVQESRLFRTPREIASTVIKWHSAQKAMIESEIQLEYGKQISARLRVIEAIDFDTAGYMVQKAIELETEINNKLLSQQSTRKAIEAYVHSGNEIDDYINAISKVLDQYEDWKRRAIANAEFLLDRAFELEIDATHQQLATVGNQLREAERRDTEIKLLEETVDDATDAFNDLQALAKALSPKGGLIGQYMLGFLQGVTQLVNTIIAEVWTYPMEVLPAKVDRDDLDYKFPLRVANGAVQAPDIDFGSDSQKEIVNFAFRVAMMKFMGFDDYPLMLDEFGRTFDEQHRANLIPFVSRLIELGQFQQIFFISHFESTHGAFNQAEVMVLDPTNVTVPEVFNKNVVMK